MRRSQRRPAAAFGAALAFLLTLGAGPSSSGQPAGASARAVAISVTVPGQAGGSGGVVSAPPDSSTAGSFSYGDGLVIAGSISARASALTGARADASASSDVSGLSLFNGEVTVASVSARVHATASASGSSSDTDGSGVAGFVVAGQAVSAGAGRVSLGDWGYATMLGEGTSNEGTRTRGSIVALEIRLTADHGGLPAGSSIQVGFGEATAEVSEAPPPTTTKERPAATSPPKAARSPRGSAAPLSRSQREERGDRIAPEEPNPSDGRAASPFRRAIPRLTPKLTPGGYVFPVYGPSSFGDTFAAPRGSGVVWHHGEDIFAPLGAPVLAVADGTVFSVGRNKVGGLRLWLRDRGGNTFYYAHLSAFSPNAVNRNEVKAGEVLGFVGTTGDAAGTPPHLHFEIHHVTLLGLGYDESAVPPYPYLIAWRRLEDVSFAATAGWAPPIADSSRAPRPGAILLEVSDISSASGLEPGALKRAMSAPVRADGAG